jgi:hypothetical protein
MIKKIAVPRTKFQETIINKTGHLCFPQALLDVIVLVRAELNRLAV